MFQDSLFFLENTDALFGWLCALCTVTVGDEGDRNVYDTVC